MARKKDSFKQKISMANIIAKANNHSSLRVIYKSANNVPEVKIINDVYRLKKAIIQNNLSIIPYQTLYIICNNKKAMEYMTPNIALPFYKISGDLLLVNIDQEPKEFKSISQEDIIWFTKDLINKSFNNDNVQARKQPRPKSHSNYYERDYTGINNTNNFEKQLIDVLINIELTLASLLKNE